MQTLLKFWSIFENEKKLLQKKEIKKKEEEKERKREKWKEGE